jgi:hypothetical protein
MWVGEFQAKRSVGSAPIVAKVSTTTVNSSLSLFFGVGLAYSTTNFSRLASRALSQGGPMIRAVATLIAIFLVPSVLAAADFYLYFNKCKLIVSYFVHSDESLKVVDGDGSLTSCTRISQTVTCRIDFLDTSAAAKAESYKIDLESGQFLIFTDDTMGDYYVIDTSQRIATVITRVMSPKFTGSKVCNGLYLTASEWKEMQKSKR